MAKTVEYLLHCEAMREGSGPLAYSHTISAVITKINEAGWEADVTITTVDNTSPRDFRSHIVAADSTVATTKATAWVQQCTAEVLDCKPEQVVLAHELWQYDD